MPNVEGSVGVVVTFSDSTTISGVSRLKTLSINEVASVSGGVAVAFSGTVGTSSISIEFAPSLYKNSAGDAVDLTGKAVRRLYLQADGPARVQLEDIDFGQMRIFSRNGVVASSSFGDAVAVGVTLNTDLGTNTYKLVVYSD